MAGAARIRHSRLIRLRFDFDFGPIEESVTFERRSVGGGDGTDSKREG